MGKSCNALLTVIVEEECDVHDFMFPPPYAIMPHSFVIKISKMSEEIMVMGKSELRMLIHEVLEDFFENSDLLNKPIPPISYSVNEKLISLREVRKIVGCSAPKLFMLRKAKRFPPEIRIGKSVFFDRQKFFDFLEKGGTNQGIVR